MKLSALQRHQLIALKVAGAISADKARPAEGPLRGVALTIGRFRQLGLADTVQIHFQFQPGIAVPATGYFLTPRGLEAAERFGEIRG